MEKNRVALIKTKFDENTHRIDDTDVEYWFARDLMVLLGYER